MTVIAISANMMAAARQLAAAADNAGEVKRDLGDGPAEHHLPGRRLATGTDVAARLWRMLVKYGLRPRRGHA